jgi:hypothetical protein
MSQNIWCNALTQPPALANSVWDCGERSNGRLEKAACREGIDTLSSTSVLAQFGLRPPPRFPGFLNPVHGRMVEMG